jgi:hypothetical protein
MPRRARQRAGERLREDLLGAYDLDVKELALLDAAALTANAIEDLQVIIDKEGTMLDDKPHPALVEARMQRLTMGRLLAGLRLPADEERSHQPHRGPRGFYGPQGVA